MFRKSSYSGDTNCVEVDRDTPGKVKVRDSKSRAIVLTFTTVEWRAFILGARHREFDA